MYKILIKKPQLPKGAYVFYTEVLNLQDEETGLVNKTTVVYETESLEDLADKYEELLKTYTTEQLKLVNELDIDFNVNVNDSPIECVCTNLKSSR